ncbi:MAG TPA: M20 family metallopeptidase [Bacillota bacterium]|nr:M20 family metallopeptidase [Bacillota bacterium]
MLEIELTKVIKELVDSIFPRLVEMRRHFHMYPELSHKEYGTTAKINGILDEFCIDTLPLNLPTGTAAIIHGSEDGPVIAIRGDIDALPIQEESELPFKSRVDGVSHMCGHDVHTTVALGSAIVLKELNEKLNDPIPGSVKFLFQPAEELEGGAESMIEAGVLQDVKAIIGLHNYPDLPVGTLGIKEGFLMASVDDFYLTIKGKGGHAGIPENTIDPIVIGSAVVQLLQTIASRVISPKDSCVITIGQFHAGTINNVIPDRAYIDGTVRSSSNEVRERIEKIFKQLVSQTVAAMGGEVEIEYKKLMPPVINHPQIAHSLRQSAAKVVGIDNTVEAEPTMGGEDFSFYQLQVPGCYFWLGSGNKDEGIIHNWHHPKFMVDEEALRIGVIMMVQSALDLMLKLK